MMKITFEKHFNDSDMGPEKFPYIGYDRRIATGVNEYFVRSYDYDSKRAIIMEPEHAIKTSHAKELVEFLATEFGYTMFEFPCARTGLFEEIDPYTMEFSSKNNK